MPIDATAEMTRAMRAERRRALSPAGGGEVAAAATRNRAAVHDPPLSAGVTGQHADRLAHGDCTGSVAPPPATIQAVVSSTGMSAVQTVIEIAIGRTAARRGAGFAVDAQHSGSLDARHDNPRSRGRLRSFYETNQ